MTSGPEKPIRVLVADDDLLFCHMVSAALACEQDIVVVGTVHDRPNAVLRAGELRPGVVLLDEAMPVGGGVDAARALRQLLPLTGIVMLTASDDDADIYDCLKAGANGYLLKQSFGADLAGVIRAASQQLGLLLSPAIASKLLTEFGRDRARPSTSILSEREVEVLTLVAQGSTNDDIARELWLSSHTVKRHVANILAKLHERSRSDAVAHAVQAGVLPWDVVSR